jgi:hypothetical protein
MNIFHCSVLNRDSFAVRTVTYTLYRLSYCGFFMQFWDIYLSIWDPCQLKANIDDFVWIICKSRYDLRLAFQNKVTSNMKVWGTRKVVSSEEKERKRQSWRRNSERHHTLKGEVTSFNPFMALPAAFLIDEIQWRTSIKLIEFSGGDKRRKVLTESTSTSRSSHRLDYFTTKSHRHRTFYSDHIFFNSIYLFHV